MSISYTDKHGEKIQYYDLHEVEQMTGIKNRTLLTRIYDGSLKAVKIGRTWQVSDEAMAAFLNAGTAKECREAQIAVNDDGKIVLNGETLEVGNVVETLIPARRGGRWVPAEIVQDDDGRQLLGGLEQYQPVGMFARRAKDADNL